MGEMRALSAIARIERALERIEAAAQRLPAAPAGGGPGDERLREAHETLKGKVEQAIAQIDRLLAGAEAG